MAMPAGPVYINEIGPAGNRGTIMSLWQLFLGFGSFLAYWINYACTKSPQSLGNWDWRIVMLGQLIAPVIIIVGLFFCPETPRWYVLRDPAVGGSCFHTLLHVYPERPNRRCCQGLVSTSR
jgi:MFS family permease